MSSLKVEAVLIDDILPHPNADRLELAKVREWVCVVPKGRFQRGGEAVYLPIDSILPPELESKLFPPDSKIKLHKSRIRTIKIRGAISQGLIASEEELGLTTMLVPGEDLTDYLGVKKYEPPVDKSTRCQGHQVSKRYTNPNFHKYTDIENYKNYPELFTVGEPIVVLEKIHGTNFRAGWVPSYPSTLWKKIKKFFGLLPEWEFVYGSHNVQLQDKFLYSGFYDRNVYAEAVVKYGLKQLPEGVVIYGEIYGDGIQKGYTYGRKPGERKLIIFDWVDSLDLYLSHDRVEMKCFAFSLPIAPKLYEGPNPGTEELRKLTLGNSVLESTQRVREGIVIKPAQEQTCYIGRKILKFKSDEFLLRAEDDTH